MLRPKPRLVVAPEPYVVNKPRLSASPRRDLVLGGTLIGCFFVGLLGWLSLARLDAAVYAEGAMVVSGRKPIVRHPQGGVVSELNVHEGQRVRAGQPLLTIDPAGLAASERSMASQVAGLLAQRARLIAEQQGARQIAPPQEFAELIGDRAEEARRALAQEQAYLATRALALDAQRATLEQQRRALAAQAAGYGDQQGWMIQQIRLLTEELEGARGLAAQGFTSKNRVRALESNLAGLRVSEAGVRSARAQVSAQMQGVALEIASLGSAQDERISGRLLEIDAALEDVRPKHAVARTALDKMVVRAPLAGVVLGLQVNGRQDVVAPGADLMEIVPEDRLVVAEVAVAPADADDVRLGMATEVRLSGFPASTSPILMGRVSSLSPDKVVRGDVDRFVVQVTLDAASRDLLAKRFGAPALKPGLPVSVVIPIKSRSGIDYLIDPLRRVLWRSFREQ